MQALELQAARRERLLASRRALGCPPMPTSSLRRLVVLCACALIAGIAGGAIQSAGPAGADITSRIAERENRADALATGVAEETRRIRAMAGGIAAAQARLAARRAEVAAKRAELQAIHADVVRARDRLTVLENRVLRSTDALRANLVAAYRNPQPDLVSVVLSARGFAELLERADFYKRVSDQNARIMDTARTSKASVIRVAQRLARLQARTLRVAAELERQATAAQAVETALLTEQAARLRGRDSKAAELRRIRGQLASLRERQRRAARVVVADGPLGIATNPGGLAQAPAGAPAAVAQVIAAGNAIAGLPYVYGGGHSGFRASAYDCSGSVSYALAAAGLVSSPLNSTGFMGWGESGPGQWITVYANAGHAFMVVGGWRFDTSALPGGGTRWTRGMRGTAGFVARHPPGL